MPPCSPRLPFAPPRTTRTNQKPKWRRDGLTYFRRTLWYDNPDGTRERIEEGDLLARPECLVVLGEPGMGDTELLGELATSAGTVRYTARQLNNRPDPRSLVQDAAVVVIDGLDEVAAQHDGDAVDLVLQRLASLGYPRFVLSCREYEWQAAISVAAIREQYPTAPLQLHLVPLDREQQLALLNERVGDTRARHLIEHFGAFGVDYLGNPQTLDLIARLPEGEPLPADRRLGGRQAARRASRWRPVSGTPARCRSRCCRSGLRGSYSHRQLSDT